MAIFLGHELRRDISAGNNFASGKIATLGIESQFNFVSRLARNIMLGSDAPKDLQRYDESIKSMEKYFLELQRTASDAEDKRLIEESQALVMEYVLVAYKFCQDLAAVPPGERVAHYKRFGEIATPLAEKARVRFSAIIKHKDELYEAFSGAILQRVNIIVWIAVAISLLFALLCALAALRIIRSMTRPLAEVTAYTKEVASGNMYTIDAANYPDELRILADGVGGMVRQMRAYTKGVLQSLPMPALLLNLEGRAQWWNTPLTELTGGRCELSAAPMSPENVLVSEDAVALCRQAQAEGRSREREVAFPNGHVCQMTSTPFRDDKGKLLGMLTTCFDITAMRAEHVETEKRAGRLAQLAQEATSHGETMREILENMDRQIENTADHTDAQRKNMDDVAHAVTQLTSSIMSVAQNAASAVVLADQTRTTADQGAKVIHQSIAAIDTVNGKADTLMADMDLLNKHAEDIGKILSVIADIADQTNLLALNAAIEAARAGDAGRGFAVVADEVRKLAEKTMSATSEVHSFVKAIRQSAQKSQHTVMDTTEDLRTTTAFVKGAEDALDQIVAQAVRTAESIRAIADATEQQSAASERVRGGAESVNVAVAETSVIMHTLVNSVRGLEGQADKLSQIIHAMAQ